MKQTIKLFAFSILSICIFTGFKAPLVQAATVPESCFTFDSGTETIINYDSADSDCVANLDIPSTISGNTVSNIGDFAFASKSLTSLTLPSTLTTIGEEAFRENNISSLTIPNSVTSIGGYAFEQNALTSLNLSNSLTEISSSAFSSNNLTSLIIPNSVTALESSAFRDNNLTSVTLSDNLISISSEVFAGNALTLVLIPSSVTSLDPFAFIAQGNFSDDVEVILDSTPIAIVQGTWYVRLITEDPTNPNNFEDSKATEEELGADITGDGDQDDSLGGHLINTASAVLSYRSIDGDTIGPDTNRTGTNLSSYMAAENLTNDLGLYYRLGSVQEFSAIVFSGYTTPANAVLTLSEPETEYTFDYALSATTQASESNTGGLASTGQNSDLLLITSFFMMIVAGFTLTTQRKRIR